MTPLSLIFLLIAAGALLALPRHWALLPFLLGACYIPFNQGFDVGPFSFYVIRALITVGFFRILVRKEWKNRGFNRIDSLMLAWAVWTIISSMFHKDPGGALVFRLGLVLDCGGIYFLTRCLCGSLEDIVRLVVAVAILLIPIAIEMFLEQVTGRNLFSILGAPEFPEIREGRLRSQGPFAHSILAGTIGAVCLPMMVGIWRKSPVYGRLGAASCLIIVWTSASSGPLLSLFLSILALILWRWRHLTGKLRIAAVLSYLFLGLFMEGKAYYLMARIDLTGSSTGWHRAALIDSAFGHLSEWWLAGTDYTRHWMPTGVTWSTDHTDITNYYLEMGVLGGLPTMLLFIAAIWKGFMYIGESMRLKGRHPALAGDQFMIWTLGASLFAHAATSISVAYFDQSFVFIYLTIASISTIRLTTGLEQKRFQQYLFYQSLADQKSPA